MPQREARNFNELPFNNNPYEFTSDPHNPKVYNEDFSQFSVSSRVESEKASTTRGKASTARSTNMKKSKNYVWSSQKKGKKVRSRRSPF